MSLVANGLLGQLELHADVQRFDDGLVETLCRDQDHDYEQHRKDQYRRCDFMVNLGQAQHDGQQR